MRQTAPFLIAVLAFLTYPALAQEATQPGRDALYAGNFAGARALLRPLVDGEDGRRHAALYFESFRLPGHYQEGLQESASLLTRYPSDPYLLGARARLLMEVGRLDEAGRLLAQAVSHEQNRWINAVDLADLLAATGDRRQASRLYSSIFQAYKEGTFKTADDLTAGARAAARLGSFHEANEAFRTAYRVDPKNVETLYRWAELFRAKYNEADAQRTYQEALSVNPHDPDLLVGLARSGAGFSGQEEMARQALEINAGHVGALDLLAELRILDGQYEEAEKLLQQALAVNPASIPTLGHLASIHHLRGDSAAFARTEREALTASPEAATFYVILADNLSRRYRYPDAATFAQKAVDLDPELPEALTSLGTGLLRTGRMQEARIAFQEGFDRDPFNLFAGNTLTLLDEMAAFDVLESEHFRLFVHGSESNVLGEEVLQYAEECYDSLSVRYGYQPEGKIQIEAYNDADDFAVRVAGLPHIGLLGVSFGDVVAVNTPRAQSGSEYNWARTLWHEIAHTMAIGVSRFHVPRWLTEGLSVYEEQRARPEWGREMDLELFAAYDQGRLLPLARIDQGFTRPSYPGQILLSYYHASRVIDYVAGRYGFRSVVGVLDALRTGKDIEAAFRQATGKDLARIDAEFTADLQARRATVAGVLSSGTPRDSTSQDVETDGPPAIDPNNPLFRQLREAHNNLQKKDYAAAESGFQAALALYPRYVAAGDPYRGLAEIYRIRKEPDRLADILERYLAIAEHAASEARELSQLMELAGKPDRAVYYLKRSLEVEPYDVEARDRLAALYEKQGNQGGAIQQRKAILALAPTDRARAHYNLAAALYAAGRTDESRREVVLALELAPGFRDAQRLLLQCVNPTSRP